MRKFKDLKIRPQIGVIIAIVTIILIASEAFILYVFSDTIINMTIKTFNTNANNIERNIHYLLEDRDTLSESQFQNELMEMLKSTQEDVSRSMLFIVENNQILLETNPLDQKTYLTILHTTPRPNNRQTYIQFKDQKYLFLDKAISGTGWRLISLIPRAVIINKVTFLIPIIFIISILGFVLLGYASNSTIKAITGPVESIVGTLDGFESTDHYKDIVTGVNNEVSVIAGHINAMMHKIGESNQKLLEAQKQVYELELLKIKAEISFYQSQINPHFLYNTLESIRSMATLYGANEIQLLSVSMAKIFRYAVKEDHLVTLKEELDCVKEFIDIMKLRFPDRYTYKLQISEEWMAAKVMKMMLQPIVENCFKHGFIHQKKKGTIAIRMVRKAGMNWIEVVDSGMGMSDEAVHNLIYYLSEEAGGLESSQVGLRNINKRLKLCFGEHYGIEVMSKAQYFTKVVLRLPGV